MSFLKGAWINDPYHLLEKQGNYVQHGRIIKFYNLTEVELRYEKLLSYIQNAVDVEKSDFDRNHNPLTIPYPDELVQKLSHDPAFAAAFYGLTPGRQKGYVIFFSQPKQSQTRISRIEKATSDIMAGIGLHDHYKKKRS